MKAVTQLSILLAVAGMTFSAQAQGTAFSYQGRLNLNGLPATGLYDLRFTAYAGALSPGPLGQVTLPAVPVTNGLFTVTLDFGSGLFAGPQRWLEIAVRTNGAASFVLLDPRQQVTATPYATHAGTASNVVSGSVVTSLNNLRDNVTLAAGANVSLTSSGNTLTINSSGSGAFSLNGTNAFYNAGNVGIGSATPAARLFVVSPTASALDNTAAFWAPAIGPDASHVHYGTTGDWFIRSASRSGKVVLQDYGGNVGIGTINPTDKLDVRGNLVLDPGSSPALFTSVSAVEQNRYLHLLNSPNFLSASGLKAGGVLVADSFGFADPGKNHLVVKGNVGIGTAVYDFSSKLTVDGQDALYITGFQPFLTLADSSANVGVSPPRRYMQVIGDDLHFLYRSGCTTLPCPNVQGHMTIKGNGNVGIGTTTPQAKLDVAGTIRSQVLTITGGADIAEPFKLSSGDIPKGAVVVIDEQNPGHLKLSTASYDTRVAGVVSGANGIKPGISLHQEGVVEGGENVALSGRVYVQADAATGAIKPGDLLTTSETPGHAMKVLDHTKAQGAILGKAMSSLKEGKGTVLMLVTLQ